MMISQRDEIASRLILSLRNTSFNGILFGEGDAIQVPTSYFPRVYSRILGFSVDESLVRDALNRLAEVDLIQVSQSKQSTQFVVVATENGRRFVADLDDSRVKLPEDLRLRIKAMWLAQGGSSHDRVRAEAAASFENEFIEIEVLRNLLGSFQSESLMTKPQVSGSTINMFFSMADDTQKNFELRNDESWISWDCLGVRKQLSDCIRAIRREAADPARKGGSKVTAGEFKNENLVVAMSHMGTVYMANCCLAVESSKSPKKYFVLPCRSHGEAIVKLMGGDHGRVISD